LSWTSPSSTGGSPITGYNVYRGTASGAEVLLTSGITTTSYTNASLTNGTTYYYKVTAVNAAGEGPASNEVSAIPRTIPSAPQVLTATPGNGLISLSWSAPASDGGSPITGYNVYRGTVSGAETLLASGVATTSYADGSVAGSTKYYYKVTAVNAAGESPASNEASATLAGTPPSSPQNLMAATGTKKGISLQWSAPLSSGSSSITGYNVYRSTRSGGETLLARGVTGTTYQDNSAKRGTTYYYWVTAVNASGESVASNEASATAK
jgi:fibronectin type 3 domain-containing protein